MYQIIGDIELDTNGPSLVDITRHIASWIKINKFEKGILNLYILHTSASLLIQENADPDVLEDLLKLLLNSLYYIVRMLLYPQVSYHS